MTPRTEKNKNHGADVDEGLFENSAITIKQYANEFQLLTGSGPDTPLPSNYVEVAWAKVVELIDAALLGGRRRSAPLVPTSPSWSPPSRFSFPYVWVRIRCPV